MDKKRIVFLSAKSGGGHDGAARALIQLIESRFPGQYVFDIIDIYNDKVDKALPFLAQIRHHSDLLWRLFLGLTNNRFFVAVARVFMRGYMLGQIKKQLPANTRIDVLVAVHFNPAQLVAELADSLPDRPRAVILATDYDPHWSWIGQADAIVVASEAGRSKALARGYRPQDILQLQVLPNERSNLPRNVVSPVRDHSAPLRLLMVSGQDGSNSAKILAILEGIDTLEGIHKSRVAKQVSLDIYCGRNEALKKAVETQAAKLSALAVRAHGFVPGLHEKIAQADLVLMRASPQILSECISAGVPVLAFDWSVHEQYQAVLINREQIGIATKDIHKILAQLVAMVGTPSAYATCKAKVNALADTFDSETLLAHLLCAERDREMFLDGAANRQIQPG